MKAKTIEKILGDKFAEFIATIEDESLRARVRKGSIITGGCIASMLLRETVNDYDVYFTTHDLARDVAEYFVKKFLAATEKQHTDGRKIEITVEDKIDRIHVKIQSAGIAGEGSSANYAYFEQLRPDAGEDWINKELVKREGKDEEKDYRPIFLSSNAIMLSGAIQLIVRFFGEPEEIHASYDFRHCTCFWRSDDGKVRLNQGALECLLAKELQYVGSKYPLCSIIRTRKFIARGWTINAGQFLKMILQVRELDLFDKRVLEEQLIGVDSAYFSQVIDAMKELDPTKMNAAYLSVIIDKIF